MKKIFFKLLTFVAATSVYSQTGTLAKTYSVQNFVPAGITVRSVVYGNYLYNIYNEGPAGLAVQKNDLNGVPLTKRIINGISPSPMTSFFVNASGGDLYISGSKSYSSSTVPFLIKIDTVSCTVVFSSEYPVGNFNYVRIYDSRILGNGNIVMAGSATNTGSVTNEYGFILGANLATNGMLAHSNTIAVNSQTSNVINSITEISNSSLIFSATSGGQLYVGKALKTTNSLTITTVSGASGSYAKVEALAGQSKFLAHNNSNIYKIDTNITTLLSPQQGITFTNTATSTHFAGNNVYRILGSSILQIIDTSFAGVAQNTYSSVVNPPAVFAQSIARNSTNLFINYSQNQTTSNFYLIKTDLMGQMNCSSPVSGTSSATALNGGVVSINTNTCIATTAPSNPGTPTFAVTYTPSCSSVGLTEIYKQNDLKVINRNGVYAFESALSLSKLEIYDLNGKMLRNEKYSSDTKVIETDLSPLPGGIYLAKLTTIEGQEFKIKLIR